METKILTTSEEFAALEPSWNELHSRIRGTVFQSFVWVSTWWSVQENAFPLRILTIRRGGQLVGIFPCFIDTKALKIISVRRLRFMGEREIYGECGPLVDPACLPDVVETAARFFEDILDSGDCDLIDFHHFSPALPFYAPLLNVLGSSTVAVYHDDMSLPRLSMPVPPTRDAYLKSLNKSERQSLTHHQRRLAAEGAELEVFAGEIGDEAFDDMERLHTTRWTANGPGGLFLNRPGFGKFLRLVTKKLSCMGAVRLHFMKMDGYRFAGQLGFVMHDDVCIYINGRDPFHKLGKFSPGKVLMLALIEEAIEKGYKAIDFQEGNTPYKFSMGGKDTGYVHMVIHSKGLEHSKGWLYRKTLSALERTSLRDRAIPVLDRFKRVQSQQS